MRLMRLNTVGFKSFADPTKFEFESGVTAIIGPNGSGKSNVVDAIKWVLGESRPKSLRGGGMQDVVFKGAAGRSGAGFAQVEVVLDNENGELVGRGAEVSIGRRLFKTGESEYLVDRQVVRRKDVREILLDTGLGVGAYSVMEQGRIDALLSADPRDRRQIFEEASGISKFKLRRKEAIRKLERTEQNLLRVRDLLDEKQKRLRSLKIQAGRARRYTELKDEMAALQVASALTNYDQNQKQRDEIAAELEEVGTRLAEIEAALEMAVQELDEQRKAEELLVLETEHLSANLTEVRSREEGTRERMRSLERQQKESSHRAEEAGERRQRILSSRTRHEQEFFTAQQEVGEKEKSLISLREGYEGARHAHSDRAAQLRSVKEELSAAEEQSLEWLHRIARTNNQVSDAEGRLRALEETLSRQEKRVAELENTQSELSATISQLREAEKEKEFAAEEARNLQADAVVRGEEAAARAAGLQVQEQELREQVSGLASRLEVLRDLEVSLAGMGEAPRRLMEEKGELIAGRLVDFLECAGADARALEAALGARLDGLVVDSVTRALEVLEWIRTEKVGYLHLVIRRSEQPAFAGTRALPQVEGVLGWLGDRIDHPEGFGATAVTLLGRVLLVESVAAGREASRLLGQGYFCVTPAGERIEGGCLVSGGYSDVTAGPVQRRSELKEVDEQVRHLRASLDDVQNQLQAVRAQQHNAIQIEKEAANTVREIEDDCRKVASEILRSEERAAGLARERETLRQEREDTLGLRDQEDSALAINRAQCQEHREAGTKADEALSNARAMVEEITAHREQSLSQENQLRVDMTAAASELEGLHARISVLSRNVKENGIRVEELRAEEEGSRATAEEARRALTDLEEKNTGFLEERSNLEVNLRETQQNREEAKGNVRRIEDQVEAGRREAENLRRTIEQASFRDREALAALGRVRDQLLAEHDLDFQFFIQERGPFGPPLPSGCDGVGRSIFGPLLADDWKYPEEEIPDLRQVEGFDSTHTRDRIAKVRRKLERIGTVNLRAVGELDSEEKAVMTLARDEEDLRQGRLGLGKMIEHINEESSRLFKETFSKARENFVDIFRKLFQGGKADMVLAEADDPLEAGIEIIARPPGKKLQNINLLSGGERSLCALAILFGVFKVKPSPFAVLDEVDAALDDSNVDRFLEVLQEFVHDTQFLVVTHNKRTMEFAQVLYGITMQRKGISSCVSVRIDQVDEVESA